MNSPDGTSRFRALSTSGGRKDLPTLYRVAVSMKTRSYVMRFEKTMNTTTEAAKKSFRVMQALYRGHNPSLLRQLVLRIHKILQTL